MASAYLKKLKISGIVLARRQNGVELKNNIKRYWWDAMTLLHENIVGIDSAIFMHPTIWKASGHVDAGRL